jgi:hypothetical protein
MIEDARDRARPGRQEAGVVALVFAGLPGIGGEHGDPVQGIDLDLDDARALHVLLDQILEVDGLPARARRTSAGSPALSTTRGDRFGHSALANAFVSAMLRSSASSWRSPRAMMLVAPAEHHRGENGAQQAGQRKILA